VIRNFYFYIEERQKIDSGEWADLENSHENFDGQINNFESSNDCENATVLDGTTETVLHAGTNNCGTLNFFSLVSY
jgi:hypothetical protein